MEMERVNDMSCEGCELYREAIENVRQLLYGYDRMDSYIADAMIDYTLSEVEEKMEGGE